MRILTLLFMPAFLVGMASCPTEAHRRLNHQSIGAARLIEDQSREPESKSAAKDIRMNAEQLRDTLLGTPERPQPYSPEASAKDREDADAEGGSRKWGALGLSVLALVVQLMSGIKLPKGGPGV